MDKTYACSIGISFDIVLGSQSIVDGNAATPLRMVCYPAAVSIQLKCQAPLLCVLGSFSGVVR